MPNHSNEQSETRVPLPRWANKTLDAARCPTCNRPLRRLDATAVGMRWVQGHGLLFFFECECQCGKPCLTVMKGRPMNATSLAKAMQQAALAAGETGRAVPAYLRPISDDEVKAARIVLGLMGSHEEFLAATGMTPEDIQRHSQPTPEEENPDSQVDST